LVLKHAGEILGNKKSDDETESFVSKGALLNYLVGTIDSDQALRFERMIFRATKGNVF
jgi:hypothetical protein